MKITLKNVILSFIIIFNLVIILSNFSSYEGLEIRINDSEPKPQGNDNNTIKPTSSNVISNLTSNVSNSEPPRSNKSKSETPLGNDFNETPLGNDFNETPGGNNSKSNSETPM